MSTSPLPLPENAGLAFIGEAEWAPAIINARQTKTFSITPNPTGRPNRDVLRPFVGKTGKHVHEHWQIDFPPHYREQEAALHERPYSLLQKNIDPKSGNWWINPHAQMPLRHALARLDRFLATALDAPEPVWTWFDSAYLPDASLLVIARDDDFTHAVLQSNAFTTWWHAHSSSLSLVQVVESFAFPWPPATPLGSLTKAQQDLRSQAARAGLAGDPEQIDSTVTAAYGWRSSLDSNELLNALGELHRQRQSR